MWIKPDGDKSVLVREGSQGTEASSFFWAECPQLFILKIIASNSSQTNNAYIIGYQDIRSRKGTAGGSITDSTPVDNDLPVLQGSSLIGSSSCNADFLEWQDGSNCGRRGCDQQ